MQPISKPLVGFLTMMALGVGATVAAPASAATTETIVLVRHGEKPALGLGQLDCQGLNRALALPSIIQRAFGRPDAIYAPDPGETKDDLGKPYDYVRPLATIEPAAIAFDLPIHAGIGVSHIDALRPVLEAPRYRGSLLLVAWEHAEIVRLARLLMARHGGDPHAVPDWQGSDFDSIYVIRLTWTNETATIAFERQAEHLDGQSATCPGPAPRG
jgi:hypothetical protein